ncbi:hypothetical protein [Falsibacillus albus]|uniref:YfcC family protein n=1 Tax=Falsibacillus albus TaxID=2478915 RepID=A0A3L7JYP0_9BACI|nr:hypothetical protein [Falsibacillus albus]RLQ95374.1 hypothetical protein D9X91_10055 [Falsibacillus albus]
MEEDFGIKLNKKAFIQSFIILFALLMLSGVLTRIFHPGHFERIQKDGHLVIDPASFQYYTDQHDFPIFHWFTAPFEVLFSHDALITITIILFILIVGGAFAVFDYLKVLDAVIGRFLIRFGESGYVLIALFSLFFMLLGAVFGILEEVIPLIPIMIKVSYRLGWDKFMGLGLSLLSVGFGFSAAIYNPFTIGVAQKLADVPMFSGILYRVLFLSLHMSSLFYFYFGMRISLKTNLIINMSSMIK